MVFIPRSPSIIFPTKKFSRPLKESDEPVAPNLLHEHCQANNIPGPGCLCPLKYADQPPYLESSISLVKLPGSHNGEHAAQCSVNGCGYFGMISSLLYVSHRHLNVIQYPFSVYTSRKRRTSMRNVRPLFWIGCPFDSSFY